MPIPGLYILEITLGAFGTSSTIFVNKCMAYWLILAFGADTLKFEQSQCCSHHIQNNSEVTRSQPTQFFGHILAPSQLLRPGQQKQDHSKTQ